MFKAFGAPTAFFTQSSADQYQNEIQRLLLGYNKDDTFTNVNHNPHVCTSIDVYYQFQKVH